MLTWTVLAHDATMVVLGGATAAEADVGVLWIFSANGILRLSAFGLVVPLHN